MTTSFSIDYDWLHGEYGDAVEKSTLAELAINIGGSCATQVEDILAKTVRSSARLSAFHLAEWFATNWWRLLWEPEADTYSWRASHRVGNAGNGYVWPDLSFSSDWHSVLVSTRPTARWDAEPIRYLNRFDIFIPISEFQRGLDDFVNGTIARLSSLGNMQSHLDLLWSEVLAERNAPEDSEGRRLEACMGYDPDESPPGLIDSLREQMNAYGTGAIREIAAASKDRAVSDINYLQEAAQNNGMTVDVPHLHDIQQRLKANSSDSDIPWRRAERAARMTRDIWGLESPISTEKLSELFGFGQVEFFSRTSHL